jgi:hypothetical protein
MASTTIQAIVSHSSRNASRIKAGRIEPERTRDGSSQQQLEQHELGEAAVTDALGVMSVINSS